jgi:tetratricopeptide (TPR) repeat protein
MASAARCVLLLAAFILTVAPGFPASLDELKAQLALASEDNNTLARIELLRRIIDADPGDAGARTGLIELWLAVPDYDMAGAALADWKNPPLSLAARTTAQIQWRRDNDPDGAIRTLRAWLASSPDDEPALADLSAILGATGQWKAQIDVLDRLLALAPRSPGALLDRANAKRRSGAYAAAIKDAQAAAKLDPEADAVKSALPAYERLAAALEKIAALDARLAADPRDLTAILLRAYYFADAAVWERALDDAGTALAIDPQSTYARITKARALRHLGKRDGAVDAAVNTTLPMENARTAAGIIDADAALARDARDAAALGSRAHFLNASGQFALALLDADAALALDEDATSAAIAGVAAAANLGQMDDAVARLRRLDATRPPKKQLAAANGLVAEAAFRNGRSGLALDYADKALRLDETEYMLRIKAQCLQRLGRAQEAADAIQRADQLGGRP